MCSCWFSPHPPPPMFSSLQCCLFYYSSYPSSSWLSHPRLPALAKLFSLSSLPLKFLRDWSSPLQWLPVLFVSLLKFLCFLLFVSLLWSFILIVFLSSHPQRNAPFLSPRVPLVLSPPNLIMFPFLSLLVPHRCGVSLVTFLPLLTLALLCRLLLLSLR